MLWINHHHHHQVLQLSSSECETRRSCLKRTLLPSQGLGYVIIIFIIFSFITIIYHSCSSSSSSFHVNCCKCHRLSVKRTLLLWQGLTSSRGVPKFNVRLCSLGIHTHTHFRNKYDVSMAWALLLNPLDLWN